MVSASKTFKLDARLQADTLFVCSENEIDILLMNDSRWPWIIVVPRVADAADIDDFDDAMVINLSLLSAKCSSTLKNIGVSTSTNVATLSNVVTQFHQHIVGRRVADPNWPGPVWGFGERIPYKEEHANKLIGRLRTELRTETCS